MKPGARPIPTEQKRLEGNRGKRPLNENEPKPQAGNAKCPDHLSHEAKKEWRRIVPELERIGVLTMIDIGALAACCQLYGRWVELERGIEKEGMYIDVPILHKETGAAVLNKDGKPITIPEKNPKVAETRLTLQQYRAYCGEFGLTPSSRTRLTVPESADEDDNILD